MAVTATDIVNQAIQLIGNNQDPVTGNAPNFDNSAAGKAAAYLYTPCVNTVARQFGYDFARNLAALALSGNAAPPGWAYEYIYPTNGIQVRQLMPAVIADPNDPLPVNWSEGNTLVGPNATKVIWTNLDNAVAAFTNQPPESLWDSLFREAVVRLLASEMAMALEARPDTAQAMLTSAEEFGQFGQIRDS